MVPGTAERDRFTNREQWKDWWQAASPPGGRPLSRVNASGLWTWRRPQSWRWSSRQPGTRPGWGWARPTPGREAATGY